MRWLPWIARLLFLGWILWLMGPVGVGVFLWFVLDPWFWVGVGVLVCAGFSGASLRGGATRGDALVGIAGAAAVAAALAAADAAAPYLLWAALAGLAIGFFAAGGQPAGKPAS